MKLILYLVLGFLFTALLTINCLAQEQEKEDTAEEVKVDEAHTWDFGQVEEGQIVTHEFTLKNDDWTTVRILDIRVSCGCITPKVRTDMILPQTEILLRVEFDTKGYSGGVQQYIYVDIKKITEEDINFKVKADVIKNKKQEG